MEIKRGMIGLSGGNSFIQRAIRFFTGSKFSHSFTIIAVGEELSALETTETRVTITPINLKLKENNWVQIWEVFAKKEEKLNALNRSYYNHSGKMYGYKSYLWFLYRYFARKFGKDPTRMWGWASKGITCTELTCDYLAKLFPEIFINDLNTYSPEELRKLMLQHTDKFICLGWYKE